MKLHVESVNEAIIMSDGSIPPRRIQVEINFFFVRDPRGRNQLFLPDSLHAILNFVLKDFQLTNLFSSLVQKGMARKFEKSVS